MSSSRAAIGQLVKPRLAWPAMAALVAIAWFVLSIVALHFLRFDHDPVRQTTSQYVVGPYGFLMTSTFFSMSVASLALIVGLSRGISGPARSRLGLGLLALWAVGVLIAMVFPINVDGTPLTTSAVIHRIAGPLAFLSLTLGAMLVSRRLKEDERWRSVHGPALILSLLMLIGFTATFVNIAAGLGFAGLSQRILLATVVAWFVLTALRLRSLARATT